MELARSCMHHIIFVVKGRYVRGGRHTNL
uniref:Uncharacterized protein n=1 Tax=Arundo donax TaxID=35708 RepID=A0A0A8Y6U2_ARUDO